MFIIRGYSLLKGSGRPVASVRFTVGGHKWVLLFYPDGGVPERCVTETTEQPTRLRTNYNAFAAIYVSLVGEGPPPQGVLQSSFGGRVGRCRLTPGSMRFARAWFQRLKLKYDEQLSNFAFKFNLRRYSLEIFKARAVKAGTAQRQILPASSSTRI